MQIVIVMNVHALRTCSGTYLATHFIRSISGAQYDPSVRSLTLAVAVLRCSAINDLVCVANDTFALKMFGNRCLDGVSLACECSSVLLVVSIAVQVSIAYCRQY
jgi:hypothetical protein